MMAGILSGGALKVTGKQDGHVDHTWADKIRYIGLVQDGTLHGRGSIQWPVNASLHALWDGMRVTAVVFPLTWL